MTDFSAWTKATGSMPWGVQSAFKTALEAVADGDIKMVYGADSYNGSPCLVNAINQMIHKDAGASPTEFAGDVVSAFDSVNSSLAAEIGDPNANGRYVTPFVAEILLQKFGVMALKPADEDTTDKPTLVVDDPYIEKSDDVLMTEWLAAQTKPAEQECEPLPEMSEQDMAEIESYLKQ